MSSMLTIPGLEGPAAHEGRARRGAPVARESVQSQPALLQRLLGERDHVDAPAGSAHDEGRTPGAAPVPATHDFGGGVTLDEVLVGAWEDLIANRTVSCPACGSAMAPRPGAGPEPVGGRCGGCGTTLA